jgi:anti-anti-sigma factor
MILRAKNEGEVLILELEGQLDFETTLQFQETCTSLIQKNESQKVVFNLEKLKFVGSSGINHFIRIMKDFNNPKFAKTKPKLCSLSTEFHRIFRAYQAARNPFDIFENFNEAVAAFDAPPVKKTVRAKKGTA